MKNVNPDCSECKSRVRSLFNFCHANELEEVSSRKSCTFIRVGQMLFHEGSMPSGLFCLYEGKVKLHKIGSDGKEQIVRLIRPGDFMGYRALMSNTPYSSSATALEDARVCMVPKDIFYSVLKNNANFSEGLLKMLCHNLEVSEQRLTEMAYKPVRERLAEALLLLKATYEEEKQPDPFTIAISREDLASLVGTAKETVIRILGDLKGENIVKTEGRRIIILNTAKLEEISSMYD